MQCEPCFSKSESERVRFRWEPVKSRGRSGSAENDTKTRRQTTRGCCLLLHCQVLVQSQRGNVRFTNILLQKKEVRYYLLYTCCCCNPSVYINTYKPLNLVRESLCLPSINTGTILLFRTVQVRCSTIQV